MISVVGDDQTITQGARLYYSEWTQSTYNNYPSGYYGTTKTDIQSIQSSYIVKSTEYSHIIQSIYTYSPAIQFAVTHLEFLVQNYPK